MFYGYLNLESTKTFPRQGLHIHLFYGYLNLESTKTQIVIFSFCILQIDYSLIRQKSQSLSFKKLISSGSILGIGYTTDLSYWYKLFKILMATISEIPKLIYEI